VLKLLWHGDEMGAKRSSAVYGTQSWGGGTAMADAHDPTHTRVASRYASACDAVTDTFKSPLVWSVCGHGVWGRCADMAVSEGGETIEIDASVTVDTA